MPEDTKTTMDEPEALAEMLMGPLWRRSRFTIGVAGPALDCWWDGGFDEEFGAWPAFDWQDLANLKETAPTLQLRQGVAHGSWQIWDEAVAAGRWLVLEPFLGRPNNDPDKAIALWHLPSWWGWSAAEGAARSSSSRQWDPITRGSLSLRDTLNGFELYGLSAVDGGAVWLGSMGADKPDTAPDGAEGAYDPNTDPDLAEAYSFDFGGTGSHGRWKLVGAEVIAEGYGGPYGAAPLLDFSEAMRACAKATGGATYGADESISWLRVKGLPAGEAEYEFAVTEVQPRGWRVMPGFWRRLADKE
jgi:hypothetical protein